MNVFFFTFINHVISVNFCPFFFFTGLGHVSYVQYMELQIRPNHARTAILKGHKLGLKDPIQYPIVNKKVAALQKSLFFPGGGGREGGLLTDRPLHTSSAGSSAQGALS